MFLTNKGSDFNDGTSTVKGMRSARSSNGRPLIEAQPGRERSAEEARKLVLTTQHPAHLDRYLHRSESSPFPPEYSFYLLGDVRGKTVLDLGCGSGEIPLVRHGANVIGIDISPELVELAAKRLDATGTKATLKVGSAYETGLQRWIDRCHLLYVTDSPSRH